MTHAAGTTKVTFNQHDANLAGKWISLGVFTFGAAATVEVSGENGQACADAVRFVSHWTCSA